MAKGKNKPRVTLRSGSVTNIKDKAPPGVTPKGKTTEQLETAIAKQAAKKLSSSTVKTAAKAAYVPPKAAGTKIGTTTGRFKHMPDTTYESEYSIDAGGTTKKTTPIKRRADEAKIKSAEPYVIFSQQAHLEMTHIVDKCTQELGWWFLVDVLPGNGFFLHTLIVPKQTVSATSVEIDPEDLATITLQLMDEGKDPSTMYAWFHSHVNMGVTPSGTDEDQVEEYLDDCPIFIRGIVNKRGDTKLDVFLRDEGVAYCSLPLFIEGEYLSEEEKKPLDELLKTNVSTYTATAYTGGVGGYYETQAKGSMSASQAAAKRDGFAGAGNRYQPGWELAQEDIALADAAAAADEAAIKLIGLDDPMEYEDLPINSPVISSLGKNVVDPLDKMNVEAIEELDDDIFYNMFGFEKEAYMELLQAANPDILIAV